MKALAAAIIILLFGSGAAAAAAEKLPLMEFLRDVREQLISFEQQSGEYPVPATIKNVHVEMHVIADKDEQGRTTYYVIEGLADKNDVVTQKISLDLELHTKVDSTHPGKRHRTYSTRNNNSAYRQRGYDSGRPYYYPPEHYMLDIYPVILYDNKRHH